MFSMTVLYGIPNCDTVKKARAWLDAAAVAYSFHDYKRAGVPEERLRRWVDRLGWEALLNRAGATFRNLSEVDKADLNEDKAITLMLAYPAAVRRPVLEAGETLLVGFKPEMYAAALA